MGIICQSVSKVLFIVKCLDHIIFTTIKIQIISWIINIQVYGSTFLHFFLEYVLKDNVSVNEFSLTIHRLYVYQ